MDFKDIYFTVNKRCTLTIDGGNDGICDLQQWHTKHGEDDIRFPVKRIDIQSNFIAGPRSVWRFAGFRHLWMELNQMACQLRFVRTPICDKHHNHSIEWVTIAIGGQLKYWYPMSSFDQVIARCFRHVIPRTTAPIL